MDLLKKIKVLETLNRLPEDFTIDELIDHLLFIDKIDKGLKDSKSGKTFTTDQAKEKLKKWLK